MGMLGQTQGWGVLSRAQSYTFVEIDHEIISMVILLLPLIQDGLLSPRFFKYCNRLRPSVHYAIS